MNAIQFGRASMISETFPMISPADHGKYYYGGGEFPSLIDSQHAEDLVCAALERWLIKQASACKFPTLEVRWIESGWLVKMYRSPDHIAGGGPTKLDALIACATAYMEN